MPRFGFKEIDASNWLEPDFIMRAFVRIDPTSGPTQMQGSDWVEAVLGPSLQHGVPEDVQAMFEVARGAMVYGFLFYPLYSLAAEQLFRVADAAVAHKCRSIGLRKPPRSFASRIDWLRQHGVISHEDLPRWHATREIRNLASHADRASIMTPGNAIGFVEVTAGLMNRLFGGA